MKGKISLERLGKQADKGLQAVGDAVLGKKSAKEKASNLLDNLTNKLEDLADSAGEQIDGAIDSITLSRLESKLNSKFHNLQTQIRQRRDILRKPPHSIPSDTLNSWVVQLHSMNDTIKAYPNSIWYFTIQQKIQATQEAIKAYEIIEEIIKNPNASSKSAKAAILNIKDVNIQIGAACIVLGLLVLGTLAVLAITLNPAVVLTLYPVAIPAVLSLITGAIVLNQGINDNNFCEAFEITTPRFFGKPDDLKSTKVSDAKQAAQSNITVSMK